jgi:hypothetical protein
MNYADDDWRVLMAESELNHEIYAGVPMHHAFAPHLAIDMPTHEQELQMYEDASKDAYERSAAKGNPIIMNFEHIHNIRATHEMAWRIQWEFIDACLANPGVDRVGIWWRDWPRQRALDTMCAHTIGGVVVSANPDKRFPFHFSNKDLVERQLPAATFVIFLLDFQDLFWKVVKYKYPKAWVVGIKKPQQHELPTDSRAFENNDKVMEKHSEDV